METAAAGSPSPGNPAGGGIGDRPSYGGDSATPPDTGGGSTEVRAELPFLVTHWLANYDRGNNRKEEPTPAEREAEARIRRATSELAAAFSSLGAYGTTIGSSLESPSSFLTRPVLRNRTFGDANRMHAGLSPSHLEHLAQSVALHTAAADAAAAKDARTDLLHRARSPGEPAFAGRSDHTVGGGSADPQGRILQEAIGTAEAGYSDCIERQGEDPCRSILQRPALIAAATKSAAGDDETNPDQSLVRAERSWDKAPTIDVRAAHWEVAHQTAEAVRRFLDRREELRSTAREIESLEASLVLHRKNTDAIQQKITEVGGDTTMTAAEKIGTIGTYKSSQQSSDRVISQLTRKLSDLRSSHESFAMEVDRLESGVNALEQRRQTLLRAFRDPFAPWKGSLAKGSRVGGCFALQTVLGREQGWSRGRLPLSGARSSLPRGPNPSHFLECRKNLLSTRLSHAVTINAHMNCPVYCLRFDRTGRYFVTGADDFLLKVFYIGAAQSCRKRSKGKNKSRRLRCNYGANFRGAVLVCTLRGHAGVINDIAVSMDNCFLATASVDGDVRVWGLKNGSPVAILRGHKGGANMVSWSALTPYRLVSTGSDGFARAWDIREACLKRYGSIVNQRGEYNLRLTEEETKAQDKSRKGRHHQSSEKSKSDDLLPPLPPRGESSPASAPSLPNVPTIAPDGTGSAVSREIRPPIGAAAAPSSYSDNNYNDNDIDNGIIVPPLPAAVPPLGQGADGRNQNPGGFIEGAADGVGPGDFVANDLIDEGVKLLSKYQHGTIQEEHGPGTRSRRSAVNVICVSRCPLGKHFVTGSDDGIIRIWEDVDDSSVAIVDARLSSDRNLDKLLRNTNDSQRGADKQPLLKLMGHVSTITDLAYSHAGDRILSASQKDGVVRVWNIGMATTKRTGHGIEFKDKRVTQIVINLVHPFSNKTSQPTRRRRPGNAARNAGSKVCCDVAVWTHDDSCVVTSQCVLVKENKTDIQPGSHFICMWDSESGKCLISISGAHTAQCQVLIPHPTDASIICTASTDGFLKLWDWSKGKCIFTHHNKVEFGPTDPNNRSKIGGYLDGSFNPDGSALVLTDDDGFITVLSSISENDNPPNTGIGLEWMREQYFSNDYYDLAYDRNGYCIEKGSERPPHLAPKGSRCAHNGAPNSEEINETFQKLLGPSPLPEKPCSWQREQIRARTYAEKYIVCSSHQKPTVRVSVREFDPQSTVIIRGIDHRGADNARLPVSAASAFGSSSHQGGTRNQPSASTRTMSANYRYLDYDDLIRREGNPEEAEPDSDDEEFQPTAARTHVNRNNVEIESEDEDLDLDFDDLSTYSESNNRRRSRQRNQSSSRTTEERRVRAQRRAQRSDTDFVEIGSDDELIAQFVSSNRTPSGSYVRDYTINGHYWRLKSHADAVRVRRKWLEREESDSTYFGRNPYTPQMGDSIVYIPRAHFETIKECPSLSPPWQSWPTGAAWPVVRCFVRGVRYRFPYEDYFRNKQHAKCTSIVAILTLEVTGIPEISDDREFPWPRPSFIEPTRPSIFELSVFESSSCEYIIPETLYTSRIMALESHIRSRSNGASGLEVDLYYEQEQGDSDLKAWPATIEEILPDEGHSDVHLRGSGFGVVQVCDGSEENRDFVSPWELNTEGVNLTRPCISEVEKESVLKALNCLLRKEEIANHLSMPVDQERYCDYDLMIEIPMDLMLIKRRLAANFYGSKLAVASDLRLIRDNCIKYNTDENLMSDISIKMCDEFEEKVLSDEERSQMISEVEVDKIQKEQAEGRQVSSLRIRLSARTVQEATQAAGSSGGRYTLSDRTTTQGQSSLESLPAPENVSTQRQRSRRETNASDVAREVNSRSRGRNDETDVLGQMAGLRSESRSAPRIDTAASNIGGRTRMQRMENNLSPDIRRSPRTRRQGVTENGGPGDRRSLRIRNDVRQNSDRSAPVYREESDDESDEEAIVPTRTSRPEGTRRSSRNIELRNSSQIRQNGGTDDTSHSVPPSRGSTRAAARASRNDSGTRSSYFEKRIEEEESDRKEEQGYESHQKQSDSEADSKYSSAAEEESVSSDGDLSVEEGLSPPAKRSRTCSRSVRNASPATPDQEATSRQSSRNAGRQRTKYEEVDSDVDEYAAESDEEEEETAPVAPVRTSGRLRRTISPRWTGDDSQSDDDEEESDEESLPTKRRSASKRKRQPRKQSPTTKKVRGSVDELPELSKWPDIGVGNITRVTRAILTRVLENDELDMFSKPVVEAYPSIAKEYLSLIKSPMDLRTIEEERLNVYDSIQMLQDDLVLMFRNCCTFNGPNSDFGMMARRQWEDVGQIFADVCKKEGVLLPRRWK